MIKENLFRENAYLTLGAFDYDRIATRNITMDPRPYESKYRGNGWRNTKRLIEKTLDTRIYTNQDRERECYFDIGFEYDIERITFTQFATTIILSECQLLHNPKFIDFLSEHFILKFVGDNNLVQLQPYPGT